MAVQGRSKLFEIIIQIALWGIGLVLLVSLWKNALPILKHLWLGDLFPGEGLRVVLLVFLTVVVPVGLLIGWVAGRWLGLAYKWPLALAAVVGFMLLLRAYADYLVLRRVMTLAPSVALLLFSPTLVMAVGNWLGAASWRKRPKIWAGVAALLALAVIAVFAFLAGWEALFPRKGIEWEVLNYTYRHRRQIEKQFLGALIEKEGAGGKNAEKGVIFCHLRSNGPYQIADDKARGKPLLHFRYPRSIGVSFDVGLQRRLLHWQVNEFTISKDQPNL